MDRGRHRELFGLSLDRIMVRGLFEAARVPFGVVWRGSFGAARGQPRS